MWKVVGHLYIISYFMDVLIWNVWLKMGQFKIMDRNLEKSCLQDVFPQASGPTTSCNEAASNPRLEKCFEWSKAISWRVKHRKIVLAKQFWSIVETVIGSVMGSTMCVGWNSESSLTHIYSGIGLGIYTLYIYRAAMVTKKVLASIWYKLLTMDVCIFWMEWV